MKYIFYFLLIFILFGCGLDNDEISERSWKYASGFRLGHDFVDFKSGSLSLRNDTILNGDSAIAVIYKTDKSFLKKDDNDIYIKCIRTNEKGIYCDFGLVSTYQPSDLAIKVRSSSSQTDTIISFLTYHDSISFPKRWKLLEEFIEPSKNNSMHYYGCLKFSHPDILQFVKINKLTVDERTYGVFQPFDMPLKKESLSSIKTVHELRKNSYDLFADTTEDKLFISKWYHDNSKQMH